MQCELNKVDSQQRLFTESAVGRKAKIFFFTVLFMVFLSKYSFTLAGDGISGNYSFILFPLVSVLFFRRILLPSTYFKGIMIIFSIILVIATAYQIWYLEMFIRRLSSFILFMSIFFFLFIEVTEDMVKAFELALIAMSVILSFATIITYIQLGGAALGDSAKDAVGGQRYGFVYVLALWVLLFQKWKGFFISKLKYILAFVIFVGILLTFSRSSIVALAGSFFLYLAVFFLKSLRKGKIGDIAKIFLIALFLISVIVIFNYFFPAILGNMFYQSLFSFFNNDAGPSVDLSNPESSEGYRIYILRLIVDYVSHNPLTGSGYLGVWILFENHSGSAHNQYTDILFRTGIIGFILYVSLLVSVGKFLYTTYKSLFWGFIGVIIYGFFHETFKESHGGFILAFLIGMTAMQRSKGNSEILSEKKPQQ